MKRILVIRLSALGDVAILVPVLKHRAAVCPDCHFLVAAPPLLAPLFHGVDNIQFVGTPKASPRELFRTLSAYQPDCVADMHWVNRTIGMDFLFRLHGVPVSRIHKRNHRGKPSWKRYDEVFDRLGLPSSAKLEAESRCYLAPKPLSANQAVIGIAPFAQHRGKIWPEPNMKHLLALLGQRQDVRVLLFGSKAESSTLETWALPYDNIQSIAGKLSFKQELDQIAQLDVMVSMDSANMHFASCLGIPVVSIWGATHPQSGFYGWRQHPSWAVGLEMDCRPCSKYGKKPCQFGDYRCLTGIAAQQVYDRVLQVVGLS